MSFASAALRVTQPLDWGRRHWFGWITQSARIRSVLRHPDRRIATLASANVMLAAAGAIYLPVLLFTLGPILLGVAHVAADVRYLVLRRGLACWWQNTVWLGCLGLILLRVLEELGLLAHPERVEFCVAAAFLAVAACAGLRERGSARRASLALALLGAATLCAWRHPTTARLCFLHGHNAVALIAWATLFRRDKRWLTVPALLIGVATCLLASGVLYRQTLGSPGSIAFQLHVLAVARWVAPFQSARWAVGWTTTYLFLQSLHYSAWLSWIPQEEQPRRGTPTFAMSVRSLFADLGTPGVAAVCLAALAVLVGACFGIQRARALYLSLATFHGYLELALLTYFWVRQRHAQGAGIRGR